MLQLECNMLINLQNALVCALICPKASNSDLAIAMQACRMRQRMFDAREAGAVAYKVPVLSL